VEETAKRAAAAAFAASFAKKPRYGGSTALAVSEPASGGANAPSAAKMKQALAVSELQGKLSAFRRDRGVDDPIATTRKSIKLPLPEKEEDQMFERNWVGILIGRDGINKKRLEAQTGATIYIRGKGTQLRGQKNDDEELEPMHVILEADTDDQLDAARVQVLAIINPPDQSNALVIHDAEQLEKLAVAKTTGKEECAFCGKPGHHHSKCPKRKTKFTMSGVVCSACGSSGHTIRDCKGDRSNVVKLVQTGCPRPSTLEDSDFATFLDELDRRSRG